MSRPSVFLSSSAQRVVSDRVLVARLKDAAGLSARSRIEIVVFDGWVSHKITQALRICRRRRLEVTKAVIDPDPAHELRSSHRPDRRRPGPREGFR
jgi:hypothetical protein